jgi:Tfp pilus assembly protein FimV
MQDKLKEDKQKVTLYLPQELHRQLKVKAAVDVETMTDLAQRAIAFYLSNPEMVEHHNVHHGQAHQVYGCPECASHLVLRDGEMISLRSISSNAQISEVNRSQDSLQPANSSLQGEEELVPC